VFSIAPIDRLPESEIVSAIDTSSSDLGVGDKYPYKYFD